MRCALSSSDWVDDVPFDFAARAMEVQVEGSRGTGRQGKGRPNVIEGGARSSRSPSTFGLDIKGGQTPTIYYPCPP